MTMPITVTTGLLPLSTAAATGMSDHAVHATGTVLDPGAVPGTCLAPTAAATIATPACPSNSQGHGPRDVSGGVAGRHSNLELLPFRHVKDGGPGDARLQIQFGSIDRDEAATCILTPDTNRQGARGH